MARYGLWDMTLRLMRQEREQEAEGNDRLFMTRQGHPLVWHAIVGDKTTGSNAVSSASWRLLGKVEIDGGRSFSSLRNTGASMIEEIDPAVTEMYLAHVEPGMKRHYAQRDWGRLARALVQLGKKLNLE